jgi:HK97 family phage major capsid protein
MLTLIELRQKRAGLWEQAKAIHEKCAAENRDMTAEEKKNWDRLNSEIDGLREQIERQERAEKLDGELGVRQAVTRVETTDKPTGMRSGAEDFDAFIRKGEKRTNLKVSDTGAAFVPGAFYDRLTEAMKAFGGMRQSGATGITTATGADMTIPYADDTANRAVILAEGNDASGLGADPTLSSKTLSAYVYTTGPVLVSNQMLQDSAFDVEGWLARKFGERFGRAHNEHFTGGSGAGRPEGIVNSAGSGTSTGGSNPTFELLVDLQHSVDPAYRQNAVWMMNDTTVAAVKKMKDNDGRPLWLSGTVAGDPGTILGDRYVVNQDLANFTATSAKAVLYGDFSQYIIRDVQDVQVVRMNEKYIEKNMIGFIAFARAGAVAAFPGGCATAPVKYLCHASGQ